MSRGDANELLFDEVATSRSPANSRSANPTEFPSLLFRTRSGNFLIFFPRIHKNTGQPTLNASAEVIGDLIMEIVLSQWREGFVEAMDAQEFGQIADKLAGDVVALKAGCLDGQEK